MLSARELADAERQLENFQLESQKYLQTQDEILHKYSALLSDYKRLQSDHEEARESRDKYKLLVRGQDRDPFVLVLVDGDGYVFDENLVSAGAEGGSNAANLLNDAIKLQLRRLDLDHCRIMVRVYANLSGLSKALSHAKLSGAEKRSLAPFVANFNRSGDLFDFVDAGELKENADFKIRANLRQFAESTQCKHIFFAACHDVGYVSELQPYVGNKERITLIKNYAFHREFSNLGLREIELPGVFMTAPLGTDRGLKASPVKASVQLRPPWGDNSRALVCVFFQKGQCRNGDGCKFKHVKEVAAPMEKPGLPKFPMSTLAKNDHDFMTAKSKSTNMPSSEILRPFNETSSPSSLLPREEDLLPDLVALNAHQHRLDSYTPPSPHEHRTAFEARIAQQKLCNNFHIGGHCPEESCVYDHSSITPELLACLKYVARHQPCARRGTCRDAACFLGHICQKTDCRQRGGKAYCRIPMTSHTADLHVAEYVHGSRVKSYTPLDASRSLTPKSNESVAESNDDGNDADGAADEHNGGTHLVA